MGIIRTPSNTSFRHRTNTFNNCNGSLLSTMASSSPRMGFSAATKNQKRQSLLSQERVALYGLQIWPEHSWGPSEHKLVKNFTKKGAWAYAGTAPIFGYSHIISGTGKATNFEFCTHIHSINRKKTPFEISGKVTVGIVRDSRKFSGHLYRPIGRIAPSSLR